MSRPPVICWQLRTLYDLESIDKREQFTFPSRISLLRFSEDGKRLFILTANQTTYVLDATLFTAAKQSSKQSQ